MGLLGRPTREELDNVNAATDIDILEVMQIKKKYGFSQLFKYASKEALDFLRRTLVFDPAKRMTAEEALKHPFVKDFHNPAQEINCPKKIELPISDLTKLSLKEYREALYADILKKKKEQRKKWKMKYLQKLGITSDDLKSEDVSSMLKKTKKEKEKEVKKKREPNPYKAYGKYTNVASVNKDQAGAKNPADYNKMMAYKSSSNNKEPS